MAFTAECQLIERDIKKKNTGSCPQLKVDLLDTTRPQLVSLTLTAKGLMIGVLGRGDVSPLILRLTYRRCFTVHV